MGTEKRNSTQQNKEREREREKFLKSSKNEDKNQIIQAEVPVYAK